MAGMSVLSRPLYCAPHRLSTLLSPMPGFSDHLFLGGLSYPRARVRVMAPGAPRRRAASTVAPRLSLDSGMKERHSPDALGRQGAPWGPGAPGSRAGSSHLTVTPDPGGMAVCPRGAAAHPQGLQGGHMPAHWFLPLLDVLFLPPVVALAQTTAPSLRSRSGRASGEGRPPVFRGGGDPCQRRPGPVPWPPQAKGG